jgi:PPOX class probable F420-dependent enzyme
MLNFKTKFGRKVWKHIKEEYAIWLTTVGADGTPQPRPVWFVWDNDSILIYSQASAFKVAHIKKHKQVALHFSADPKAEEDVIVLLGTAAIDKSAPTPDKHRAYLKKYREGIAGLSMSLDTFGNDYPVAIRVTLTSMRGW